MCSLNSLITGFLAFTAFTVAQNARPPPGVIETEVLILGGGMTGVSAAHALYYDYNISDFLIVEARHELGGRVQDSRIGNYTIEFGANWIEGLGENPIWKLAQKFNVKNRYSNWTSIDYFTKAGWEGEDGPLRQAVTRYEEEAFIAASADAGRRKDLGLPDLSMKAGLKINGWNPTTPEEWAGEYFSHDWEYAEPPLESSFIGTVEAYNESFVESGDSTNNIVIDPMGYKQVVLRYAAEIPDLSRHTLLNQIVTNITYSNNSVTAVTSSGITIKARRAVCTFSLGVLQNDDVTFSPPLPSWKQEAIANFHMATYMKIFARFAPGVKFWNDTEFVLYADPNERGHYPIFQPLDIPGFFPGSGIIFATLTGQQAYQAEHQSDAEVQAEFIGVLRALYGAANVPDPIEFTFPRWTRDPLFRGTFTNWGAGVTVKQQDDMREPVGGELDREATLWFAGEHTSRKYFGYLHGAYWEGKLVAGKIADCMLRQCRQSASTTIFKREAGEFKQGAERRNMHSRKRRMWT
ncbi:amine oxidase [Trichophaea hybrida]|nr:amine oxidase [Trichophaea hybrida]